MSHRPKGLSAADFTITHLLE